MITKEGKKVSDSLKPALFHFQVAHSGFASRASFNFCNAGERCEGSNHVR